MDILVNRKEKRFEVSEQGQTAYLTFQFYRGDLALVHTVVPDAMQGKGVASALAGFAFDHARSIDRKVMVYCPFVGRYLKHHPELRKQLDPAYHRV